MDLKALLGASLQQLQPGHEHGDDAEEEDEEEKGKEKIPSISTKTRRNLASTINLPTDKTHPQLEIVGKTLYNINIDPSLPFSRDHSKWHAVDEVYTQAKQSYDAILSAFSEPPRLYKFESTKQKLFDYSTSASSSTSKTTSKPAFRSQMSGTKRIPSSRYLGRKQSTREEIEFYDINESVDAAAAGVNMEQMSEEERMEYELGTMINPFMPPKPWQKKRNKDGEVVYVNNETKEVKTTLPGEVWSEKYDQLVKLKQNEDLDGWEYFEDEAERRRRFRIQSEYEKRLQAEIVRRETQPNELEQVEDALFYIVDTIVKRTEYAEYLANQHQQQIERASWHPSTKGFRLTKLPPIVDGDEDEGGVGAAGIPRVTDLDFFDPIVSECGFLLPTTRPKNLFILHEREKELALQRQLAELQAKERQMNLPLSQKVSEFVELAQENPQLAVAKAVLDIKLSTRGLIKRLRKVNHRVVLGALEGVAVQGVSSLVKVLKNPQEVVKQAKQRASQLKRIILPPSKEELEMEAIARQYDGENTSPDPSSAPLHHPPVNLHRRGAVERIEVDDFSRVPLPQPDCTMVTMIILREAPPSIEKVPAHDWYNKIKKAKNDLHGELIAKKLIKPPPEPHVAVPRRKIPKKRRMHHRRRGLNKMTLLASSPEPLDESISHDEESASRSHSAAEEEMEDVQQSKSSSVVSRRKLSLQEEINVDTSHAVQDEVDEEHRQNSQLNATSDGSQEAAESPPASINTVNRSNQELPTHDEVTNEDEEEEEEDDDDGDNDDGDGDSDEEGGEDEDSDENDDEEEQQQDEGGNEDIQDETSDQQGHGPEEEHPTSIVSEHGEGEGEDDQEHQADDNEEEEPQQPQADQDKQPEEEHDEDEEDKPKKKKNNRAEPGMKKASETIKNYQVGALIQNLVHHLRDGYEGAAVAEKFVLTNKKRMDFEKQLINELSEALCIPFSLVTLEEIHPLPPEDRRLAQAKAQLEEVFKKQEEEAEAVRRKNLKEFEDYVMLLERSQQSTKERNEARILSASAREKPDVKDSVTPPPPNIAAVTDADAVDNKSEHAAEEHQASPTNGHHDNKNSLFDEKKLQISEISTLPTYFKLGLPNPDENRKDASYWLAKELRELTEDERQQKRIDNLKSFGGQQHARIRMLKAKIAELRSQREYLLGLAKVYMLSPAAHALSPLADQLKSTFHRVDKELVDADVEMNDPSTSSSPNLNIESSQPISSLTQANCFWLPEVQHTLQDIVEVLEHHDGITDPLDDYYDILDWRYEQEKSSSVSTSSSGLVGCQITLMIHLNDDFKKQDTMLRDLRSEDVATFLQQQVIDRHSILHSGEITQHIASVKLTHPMSRRHFEKWESFWVHVIHPIYFGHSTKRQRKDYFVSSEAKSRLESGLLIVNPTTTFTEPVKKTFMQLPQPKAMGIGAHTAEGQGGPLLDYNVDDIGAELDEDGGGHNALKLYRPNMSDITQRDVEKCKRVYKLMQEKYDDEMKLGLVDGARLRTNQYAALKNLQAAKRIYTVAKQKYSRNLRLEKGEEEEKPIMTKVDQDTFASWMEEARLEDSRKLKEARERKEAMKELRMKESELRKKYDEVKTWFIGKLLSESPEVGAELSSAFQQELDNEESIQVAANKSTSSSQERELAASIRATKKAVLIAEEKNCKAVFGLIHQWHAPPQQVNATDVDEEEKAPNVVSGGLLDAEEDSITIRTPTVDGRLNHLRADAGKEEARGPLSKEAIVKYCGLARLRLGYEDRRLHMLSNSMSIHSLSADASYSQSHDQEQDREGHKDKIPQNIAFIQYKDVPLLRKAVWLSYCAAHQEFATLLNQFPTSNPDLITCEELTQFVKLCSEYGAAYLVAKESVVKARNEKKASQQAKKKKMKDRQESREALKKEDEKEQEAAETAEAPLTEEDEMKKLLASGLEEEFKRRQERLAASKKRKELREKAWLFAHQHLFVKLPGKPPYCVVCRENSVNQSIKMLQGDEITWKAEFFKNLLATQPIKEREVKNRVEKAYMQKLEAARLEKLKKLEEQMNPTKPSPVEEEGEEEEGAAEDDEDMVDGEEDDANDAPKQVPQDFKDRIRSTKLLSVSSNHVRKPRQSAVTVVTDAPASSSKRETGVEKVYKSGVDLENSIEDLSTQGHPPSHLQENSTITLEEEVVSTMKPLNDRMIINQMLNDLVDEIVHRFDQEDLSSASDTNPDNPNMLMKSVSPNPKHYVLPEVVRKELSMVKIPDHITRSLLPLVDPNGKIILLDVIDSPEEREAKERMFKEKEEAAAKEKEEKLRREQIDISRKLVYDQYAHGIMIRLWNQDPEEGTIGDFLGCVLLQESHLLSPAKGIRSYMLKTDPDCVKKGREKLAIQGSLFIKLNATKKEDMRILSVQRRLQEGPTHHHHAKDSFGENAEESSSAEEFQFPSAWRLQIVRGTKLPSLDIKYKTSCFAEIFWKGAVTKRGQLEYAEDWVCIGTTSVQPETVDPEWKADPSALYELPPQWSDSDILHRENEAEKVLRGGGWVAKNHIPADDLGDGKMKLKGSYLSKMLTQEARAHEESTTATNQSIELKRAKFVDPKKLLQQAVSKVILTNKLANHEVAAIKAEVALEMATWKVLCVAEETERQCLHREEVLTMEHLNQLEARKEKPYLNEQRFYEREFSNLLQHIHEPPRILARARFLMGIPVVGGGGSKTLCEDPATQKQIDVITLPILYDEDEEELNRQIMLLLGNNHPNLAKILDFSVHQVLGFSYTGHATTNERIAMIILTRNGGFSFMEYLDRNWSSFTNAEFIAALIQIVAGLITLHKLGIIHRNIHPDCVLVEPLKPINSANPEENTSSSTVTASKQQQENDSATMSTSLHTNSTSSTTGTSSSSAAKKKRQTNVFVIGDYWFLHNPRAAGCQFSLGRADWGNVHTAPPEAFGGGKISEKSDIWGLGMCIYRWASRGLFIQRHEKVEIDFDAAFRKLPLKWGNWIHAVLRMCLTSKPTSRATAQDVYQYLILAKRHFQDS